MTSSNGNIFRVASPLCDEFSGPGEFPTQRPVTRSFDVFFDLRLNKRLSNQPYGWWFETPSCSLWRQCNDFVSKGSINNDPALFQIMAWCCSATSHYLIEWWPSSLTHISVAGNKPIIVYGECCYAMQRHRFTMNYQKAHCSTQHQPPPYASTGTQRGYADFRRHLPSSGYTVTSIFSWSKLFMCCLLYTRDWIDLNKDFHYSDAIWAPACSTSTYKNIKTLHYWSVQRLGGTAVHQWIPSQRVSNTEKVSMMWRMMSCLF